VFRVTLCRLTNARRSKGRVGEPLETSFDGLAGTRGRWTADCVVFFAIAAETKAQHTHTPSMISRLAALIRPHYERSLTKILVISSILSTIQYGRTVCMSFCIVKVDYM